MRKSLRRKALIAAATYVALGTLWILVSDSLVEALPQVLSARMQTAKGFLFVAVTGALFYAMASRWAAHLTKVESNLVEATEETARARRFVDLVVQAAPEAVVVIDRDAVVKLWSPGAQTIFGWTESETLGRFLPWVRPEARPLLNETIERLFAGESVTGLERVAQRADGSRIDVSISAAPIASPDGEIREAMAFVENISERKARERELEAYRGSLEQIVSERTIELSEANKRLAKASQAKSDFLAAMSHELRTPLNAIIGFSQLLHGGVSGPVNAEQKRQLEIVVSAAGGLLELINSILDLSRIEAGKESVNPTDCTLREIVEPVTDTLAPLAAAAGLRLSANVPHPELALHTDAGKVRQILLNLVANAIKFTDEGSVTLTVGSSASSVRFDVADTGPGLSPETLDLITEDFYRAQHPDPSRAPGTGLGLSISKRLALLLGGTIEAKSTVGEGSVFSLTIPIKSDAVKGSVHRERNQAPADA